MLSRCVRLRGPPPAAPEALCGGRVAIAQPTRVIVPRWNSTLAEGSTTKTPISHWAAAAVFMGGATLVGYTLSSNVLSDAAAAGAPATSHEHSRPKQKSPTDIEIIKKGINSNRLMRVLDPEQKENLVKWCTPHTYHAGETIVREGETGNHFFVVAEGVVDVYQAGSEEVVRTSKTVGSSFGEQGVLLGTTRSANIRAQTDVKCYQVARKTFQTLVLPSKRLMNTWLAFASVNKNTGDLEMIPSDFIDAMVVEGFQDKERLRYLFSIVDQDESGTIQFDEYAMFDTIMALPDCVYQMAFLLFDKKRDGVITKDEVIDTLHSKFTTFDFDSPELDKFFGPHGQRRLRFTDFTEMFVVIQAEIPKQFFQLLDSERKGFITCDQFVELVPSFGQFRLTHTLRERLQEIKGLRSNQNYVTYAELCAFNELLSHLPGVRVLVEKKQKDGYISKSQFRQVAHMSSYNLSPLEVDIFFNVFDVEGAGKVKLSDFYEFTRLERVLLTEPKPDKKKAEHGGDADASFTEKGLAVLWEQVQHFSLGAVAGGVGAASVYPIDLVKTRMQNQRKVAGGPKLDGWFATFRRVVKYEGLTGLYSGIGPQLVGVAPEKAIKLTVNDLLRDLFQDERRGTIFLPLEILAGASAGGSQVMFTNPLEIVKIRMQVQREAVMEAEKQGVKMVERSAVGFMRELGFLGLYKGAGACLLRDIPFSAIYFPAYAAAKSYLADSETGENSPITLLLAGAIAGAPAASLVTPADVIKTRLQVEARSGQDSYDGIRDCAKKIYQKEGFGAFWRGAPARVFRSSPQFGVTLLSYELLLRFIQPDIVPRPPTNAPVTQRDYAALSKSARLDEISRGLGVLDIGQWVTKSSPVAESESDSEGDEDA